jgi:hypothetical protein
MTHFTESAIEETALDWLKDMGYTIAVGNDIAPKNMLASLRGGMSLLRVMKGKVRVKEVEEML